MDRRTHSTLGTADFAYDSQDRLTRLTLGNGAYTDYARDAYQGVEIVPKGRLIIESRQYRFSTPCYGRFTSFDIKEIGGTRILKHEWAYDAMGRKSAAAGIAVSGGSPALPSPISFAYDSASRVTHESLGMSRCKK